MMFAMSAVKPQVTRRTGLGPIAETRPLYLFAMPAQRKALAACSLRREGSVRFTLPWAERGALTTCKSMPSATFLLKR